MRLQWIIGVILVTREKYEEITQYEEKRIKSLRRCRMKELARV